MEINQNGLIPPQSFPLTPQKSKKKVHKKSSSKQKLLKTKKSCQLVSQQSIPGKTLSTESCSSVSGANRHVELSSTTNNPNQQQNRRGSRSGKKDLILQKHVRENLNLQEHKSSHLNLLGKRFKIQDNMLGFGSFGRTYLGSDIKRNKEVAIKIMLKKKSMDSFLREATALRSLNYINANGFPQMLMSAYNDDICILVEELLGMNLETLRKNYQRLSLPVVCSIGIQLINRLETLHKCGFIHRDIKPQNIVLGEESGEKANKIFLIDFGLSIQYLDENGSHYKPNQNAYSSVVGTALFASINAHHGTDLSRRDDIESLVYTLIYLAMGTLPWKNINIKSKKERHQIIMYMKEEISNPISNQQKYSLLSNGGTIPIEFFQMLQYAQTLKFEDEPDYKHLKGLLQKVIRNSCTIKKMSDIDIVNNNNENFKKIVTPSQILDSENIQTPKKGQENIDVSGIAFQLNFSPNADDFNNSVTSNEQLVFKSDLDGRSNIDLRDEIQKKLNPANVRQLLQCQQSDDTVNKYGQMFDLIPEEEENEEDSPQEASCSEGNGSESEECKSLDEDVSVDVKDKLDEAESDQEEEDDEEDEIPDDLEICAQIESYSMRANQNDLKEVNSFQTMTSKIL